VGVLLSVAVFDQLTVRYRKLERIVNVTLTLTRRPWCGSRDGNDGDDSEPSGITRPSGHCHHLAHGRSRRLHDLRRLFTMIAVKSLRDSKTLRDATPAGGRTATSEPCAWRCARGQRGWRCSR